VKSIYTGYVKFYDDADAYYTLSTNPVTIRRGRASRASSSA
jgi:hypothetical protein